MRPSYLFYAFCLASLIPSILLAQAVDTLSTGLVSDCDAIAYRYVNPGSPPINNRVLQNPKKQADLSKYLPFIEDQGYKGACTAFSVAAALTILENKKSGRIYKSFNRADDQHYFSPAFIFNMAKSNYPVPLSSDCRSGISYIDAFLVVKNSGSVSWETYPYELTNNNQCTSLVSDKIKSKASSKRILTFQKPKISVAVFKAFLCDSNLEYPINISVNIDRNYSNAGTYPNPSQKGQWKAVGGTLDQSDQHAMCIVGYADSLHAFKALDSRGTEWGDNGFIWISYDLIANPRVVYDAFVCSFDNKLLLQTSNEASGDNSFTATTSAENAMVTIGYYVNVGNYRVCCADIHQVKGTAEILIRDSVGNPLTPITTVSKTKHEDDATLFDVGSDYLSFRINKITYNHFHRRIYFDVKIISK